MLLECGTRVNGKVFFGDNDGTYKTYSGTIEDVVMQKAWIATFDEDGYKKGFLLEDLTEGRAVRRRRRRRRTSASVATIETFI